MKFHLSAVLAASLWIAGPVAAQDASAETVLATVNGTDITLGHLIAARARLPEQYDQVPPERLFNGLLDQLINQAAIASGREGLSRAGQIALDNEHRSLLVNDAISEVAEAALTEEALQAAYEANFGGTEPEEEFNASHILVETEEKARELIDMVSGGAEFAQLARDHSTGPSGPNGGDLGWFGKGMMVPAFEEAVVAMKPGEVSEPVQTQFGWHVIRLNEQRQKDAPTLDEVRGQLVESIQREAIIALSQAAGAAADITRAEVNIDPSVLNDISLLKE